MTLRPISALADDQLRRELIRVTAALEEAPAATVLGDNTELISRTDLVCRLGIESGLRILSRSSRPQAIPCTEREDTE